MIRIIKTFLLLLIITNLKAQSENQIIQFTYNLDTSVVFIDNSPRNWYTIELKTDTLIQVENNIYFFNGKTIQIGSVQFDNGKPSGVKGSKVAEEFALESHKKWELDYQKKVLRKRLKNDKLLYHNSNGKPFLIWWFETPKSKKIPEREIEVEYESAGTEITDTTAIEFDVTHQLFLDFVIHGKTSVSISIPVLENESLDNEIEVLKKIANTLNVYGGPIDLSVLSYRLDNQNAYTFQDSMKQVSVELPDWFNVIQTPYGKNAIIGSLPEKDNIYNSIGLMISSISDSIAYSNFSNRDRFLSNPKIDNVKVITDSDIEWRYFCTKNNGYFYCDEIHIRKGDLLFYINYTATESTYDFNKERLNEFIEIVKGD